MQKIVITLGDPAGIGPEVALKAVSSLPRNFRRNIILLGPQSFYSKLARRLKLNLKFEQTPSHSSPYLRRGLERGQKEYRGILDNIPCFFEGNFPDKIVRGRSIRHQTAAAVNSIQL